MHRSEIASRARSPQSPPYVRSHPRAAADLPSRSAGLKAPLPVVAPSWPASTSGHRSWPVGQQRMDHDLPYADSAGNTCPLGGAGGVPIVFVTTIPPISTRRRSGAASMAIQLAGLAAMGGRHRRRTFAADKKKRSSVFPARYAGGPRHHALLTGPATWDADSRPCGYLIDPSLLCS